MFEIMTRARLCLRSRFRLESRTSTQQYPSLDVCMYERDEYEHEEGTKPSVGGYERDETSILPSYDGTYGDI